MTGWNRSGERHTRQGKARGQTDREDRDTLTWTPVPPGPDPSAHLGRVLTGAPIPCRLCQPGAPCALCRPRSNP